MMKKNFLFTSESVTEGHPDKVADQVSDAILDAILAKGKHGRVAVETLVKTGFAVVAGEVTTDCYVEMPDIVRQTVRDIGYTDSSMGFDGNTCAVLVAIEKQSPDIARGVDAGKKKEQGAGDQGMMFGFACDDTPQLMPAPITYAHALTRRLAEARKRGEVEWLRPDGKSQVTVEYRDGKPVHLETVVISTQHAPDVSNKEISSTIKRKVIEQVLEPTGLFDKKTKIFVNPTGRFVIGGPMGDSGVTGRKIIVDTYGGMGRHGGGAFSGKDPTKVDRSAAYAARWVAKNVVAAGLARRCEIQIAYAIGVAEPVSIRVDAFGTSAHDEDKLVRLVRKHFDLTPRGIIESLELRRPIYRATSYHGHFGREQAGFPWERTDKADALRRDASR
jgi:S-adenosylmethionine synthetase